MTLLAWPQLHVAVVVVAVVVEMGLAVVVVIRLGVNVYGVVVVGAAYFGQKKIIRYTLYYINTLITNLL